MNSLEIEQQNARVLDSKTFQRIAAAHNLENKRVLDMGCGYGAYMQRFGANSAGITTTPDEVTYGQQNNLDIRLGNVEALADTLTPDQDVFDIFWANNLFEHLVAPHAFLVQLKQFCAPDAKIILGVPVVPVIPALTKIKKFRGALASPHVNFFTLDTLQLSIKFAGWDIVSCRSFALNNKMLDGATTRLAPHLYITAQNNPDYRYPKKKLNEWGDAPMYQKYIDIMNNK
jgi:SAM-dependent methyltransferase